MSGDTTVKPRLSLIVIDCPDAMELARLVHEHQPSTEGSFRVYLDPAGHPVCLVRE